MKKIIAAAVLCLSPLAYGLVKDPVLGDGKIMTCSTESMNGTQSTVKIIKGKKSGTYLANFVWVSAFSQPITTAKWGRSYNYKAVPQMDGVYLLADTQTLAGKAGNFMNCGALSASETTCTVSDQNPKSPVNNAQLNCSVK